jgi:putative transposase
MPRKTRIPSRSNVYHVMARGNERKNLFLDNEDRIRFLDTLRHLIELIREEPCTPGKIKREKKFSIYAYCLMDNHIHLLINQEEDTISRIMKRIGTRYAYYFNKKYSRIGHLFQDRFKSEAVESDGYLMAVVRYIHNNPVKAGMVNHASQYNWSSYHDYTQVNKASSIIDRKVVLGIFSKDVDRSIELFREYSRVENEDTFLEYTEPVEEKVFQNKNEIESFIENILSEKGITKSQINEKNNIQTRKKLVCGLRDKSNLSIRQIADLLGINRGVVQRIVE